MRQLTDQIIDHLRHVCDFPDVGGTKYSIVREIQRDNDGTLYEADDAKLSRRIGLKVIDAGDSSETRIVDEARILARLDHPGIAPIYDVGRLSDGRAFYTTKIVSGKTLDQYRSAEKSLSERLRVFQRICDTVSFIHSRGVVHRALKPKNILVGPFGQVWLRGWHQSQFHGDNAGKVLHADVSALGALLGFIIEPEGPRSLKAVCNERYKSVNHLAGEIAAFLDGRPLQAYREGVWERISRWISRTTKRAQSGSSPIE